MPNNPNVDLINIDAYYELLSWGLHFQLHLRLAVKVLKW